MPFTPFTSRPGRQPRTTLEALRDSEAAGGQLAEVGSAHRFQGRQFPVVVFDTVEDDYGDGLWTAHASRAPEATAWARDGVRLCNVAVTRAQTSNSLLPALDDAVHRGVRDGLRPRPLRHGPGEQAALVKRLRAVVPTVVCVNVMHQKTVVIDEHTAVPGSLNSLSQSRSREVMLMGAWTMRPNGGRSPDGWRCRWS